MPDIAIVGGGLVGLCAALVLQHPARSVSVIEAGDLEQPQQGGLNARSIALSASSVQVFKALGLWPEIETQAAPIRHIHISSRGRWGVTRLRASDYELDALGYVVENQVLHACLLQAARDSGRIELLGSAEFEDLSQDQDKVDIGYRQDKKSQRIEVSLALIADGARSRAREALDIGHSIVDYGQCVVFCNVEVGKPSAASAYERFTQQGPLAMLPLGGKRYACVWTLSPERAQQIDEYAEAEFIEALQDCFGYRLGLIEKTGARFSLPLQRVAAESLQRGRCLLIGNAANALHPVAGQSFNLSLRDVACLYELLIEQATDLEGESLAAVAQSYEQLRLREQKQVIRYGDGLVNLFSNELPLLGQVRAAGLGLLDLLPPLKAEAALTGMGMTFGGNRLLRGRL